MDALAELQYTVVGTLMREPGKVGEALTRLSPMDFPLQGPRGLFEAIGALHFAGAPISPITVLDKAGDAFTEAAVQAADHYTLELDYYIGQLLERSRLRTAKQLAEQIVTAESAEAMESMIGRLNATLAARQQTEILRSGDAAKAFCDSQAAPPPEYYRWGFSQLDKSLYVERGDFVVVGGYPSAGKTLLSLQFAKVLAKTRRTGYFSLETSPKKLIDRLMAHMARIPLAAIKKHDLNEEQWEAAALAASDLSLLHLDFVPASGMTVRDIRAIALSQRYEVVFVDYLQLVSAGGKNRYEEVTNISKDLHLLAQTNGITVVALAQLTRPDRTQGGKQTPPGMSSFRESGQIEQDADVALLLYPADPNDNRSNRILKCGKNKDGERFRLELAFDGPLQTLSELGALRAQKETPEWVREAEKAPEERQISMLEDIP